MKTLLRSTPPILFWFLFAGVLIAMIGIARSLASGSAAETSPSATQDIVVMDPIKQTEEFYGQQTQEAYDTSHTSLEDVDPQIQFFSFNPTPYLVQEAVGTPLAGGKLIVDGFLRLCRKIS